MKIINLSEEDIRKNKAESVKRHFQSGFNFLSEHKDLRPSKNHLIVGKPSAGKSTLRNSLIYNLLQYNDEITIFLYLSEESIDDLEKDISQYEDIKSINKRLIAFSEIENLEFFTHQDFGIKFFYEKLLQSCANILIFDNVTTSKLYMGNVQSNDTFATAMKNYLLSTKIPGIFFAHTDSKVGQILDINNFRGSRTFVNLAEFQYTIDMIDVGNNTFSVVKIWKHRAQTINHTFFLLEFDKGKRLYLKDRALKYTEALDIFKNRNKH